MCRFSKWLSLLLALQLFLQRMDAESRAELCVQQFQGRTQLLCRFPAAWALLWLRFKLERWVSKMRNFTL